MRNQRSPTLPTDCPAGDPPGSVLAMGSVPLVLGAVGHGTAAMGAGVLEDTRLEEGGHGRLAVRAFHGFDIPVGDESTLAGGSRLRRGLDPDGFAFVAGDRIRADGSAGGLTGRHEGGEAKAAGKDEEACF